jgi:hypothetical protein
MPQAVHISRGYSFERDYGLNAEKVAHMSMQPGESVIEVMKRLGYGDVRIEPVPAEPRKLPEEAASFIANYDYEDPDSVLAVYWRYHSLEAEEFDTVEEAERFLDGGEEYGTLAGEAVVVAGDEIRVRD